MPIIYVIDEAQGFVSTKVCGAISVDDIVNHFEAARKEGFLAHKELIDTRGVKPPLLFTPDILRAANLVRGKQGKEKIGPRAIIAEDDVLFGLTRMFATFLPDTFPLNVFRSDAAAEEWLTCWLGPDLDPCR